MIRFMFSKITPVNWVEDLSWRRSTPTGAPAYRQQPQGKDLYSQISLPASLKTNAAYIMHVCKQYN